MAANHFRPSYGSHDNLPMHFAPCNRSVASSAPSSLLPPGLPNAASSQLIIAAAQLRHLQLAAAAAAEVHECAQEHAQAQFAHVMQLMNSRRWNQDELESEHMVDQHGMPLSAMMRHFVPSTYEASSTSSIKGTQESSIGDSLSRPSQPRACGSSVSDKARSGPASSRSDDKHSQDTLRMYLQELRDEDPRCIFITRKINKLGFRSKAALEKHFSEYGKVRHVLVAHSKVKGLPNADTQTRTRPGNFGIVVMQSPNVVEKIISEGPEQYVSGIPIQVNVFKQSNAKDESWPQQKEQKEIGHVAKSPPDVWNDLANLFKNDPQTTSSGSTGSSCHGPSDRGNQARDFHHSSSSRDAVRSSSNSDPHREGAQMSSGKNNAACSYASERRSEGSSSSSSVDPLSDAGSTLRSLLKELSKLAHDANQKNARPRDQSLQDGGLAQWSLENLKRLEEDCKNHIVTLTHRILSADNQNQASPPQHSGGGQQGPQSTTFLNQEPWLVQPQSAPQPRMQAYKNSTSSIGGSSSLHDLPEPMRINVTKALPREAVNKSSAVLSGPHREANKSSGVPSGGGSAKPMKRWPNNRSGERPIENDKSVQRDGSRSHLPDVSLEEQNCVFVARRINKLGFRSREILRRHFSSYGEVSRVLMHCKAKSAGCQSLTREPRARQGVICLIFMKDAESVKKILSLGEEHIVSGHQIRVQPFHAEFLGPHSGTASTMTSSNITSETSGISGSTSSGKSETGPSKDDPSEKCYADVGSSGIESWNDGSGSSGPLASTD